MAKRSLSSPPFFELSNHILSFSREIDVGHNHQVPSRYNEQKKAFRFCILYYDNSATEAESTMMFGFNEMSKRRFNFGPVWLPALEM